MNTRFTHLEGQDWRLDAINEEPPVFRRRRVQRNKGRGFPLYLLAVRCLASLAPGLWAAAWAGFASVPSVCAQTNELLWIKGGHVGAVGAVALSPDGGTLASVGEIYDRTVKLWRVSDGNLLRTLVGHSDRLSTVAFSPDGLLLASAGRDQRVMLWRVLDGTVVTNLCAHSSWITQVAFSPDGQSLASAAYDNTINLWRVADWALIWTCTAHPDGVNGIAFSPDGSLLASAGRFDYVKLWRVADGGLVRTFSEPLDNIATVAFSPDGRRVAAAGGNTGFAARIWNADDGTLVRSLPGLFHTYWAIAFSADGNQLLTGRAGAIEFWRVADGAALPPLSPPNHSISSFVLSADGQRLVSIDGSGPIEAWRVADRSWERRFTWQHGGIVGVAFLPDGETLVSASADRTVRMWRVADGAALNSLTVGTPGLSAMALSPEGGLIACAGGWLNTVIELWRTADATRWGSITGSLDLASSLAFAPAGGALVAGGPGVTVWSITNGALLRSMPGNPNGTAAVAVSPDGQFIASGGQDRESFGDGGIVDFGSIRLWRLTDGSLVRSWRTGYSVTAAPLAFSHDGAVLASGQWWQGQLWQSADGSFLRGLPGPCNALAFSPDGRWVAAGGAGLRVCRAADGEELVHLKLETHDVSAVAFSPDGELVACGRADATVALFRNPLGHPPPWVRLALATSPSEGKTRLTLIGDPGLRCIIQSSTNLQSWFDVTNVISASAPVAVYTPSTAGVSSQFYRVLIP